MQMAMKSSALLRPNLEMNAPPAMPPMMLMVVLTVPSMNPFSFSVRAAPPAPSGACKKRGASTRRNPSPLLYKKTKRSMSQIRFFAKKSFTVSMKVDTTSFASLGLRESDPCGSTKPWYTARSAITAALTPSA
jgi:hypothetical protein